MRQRRLFCFFVVLIALILPVRSSFAETEYSGGILLFDEYKKNMWEVLAKEPCLKNIVLKEDTERASFIYLLHKYHIWQYPLSSFCNLKQPSQPLSLRSIKRMFDEYSHSGGQGIFIPKSTGTIGVYLGIDGHGIRVLNVFPESSAAAADMRLGDYIYAVNGKNFQDLGEATRAIVGPPRSKASIVVEREGHHIPLLVERELKDHPDIFWDVIDGVGYLQLRAIQGDELVARKALDDFKNQKVKSIILDLRGNPGGGMNGAAALIGFFYPEQQVAYIRYSPFKGNKLESMSTIGDGLIRNFVRSTPLFILVDNNTASSSEIIAGALHVYHRAVIVGAATHGKGVWEQMCSMSDASIFYLTMGYWLLPDGSSINGVGIVPDVDIELVPLASVKLSMPGKKFAYQNDQALIRTLLMAKK